MRLDYVASPNKDLVEKIVDNLVPNGDFSTISNDKVLSEKGVNIDYLITLKKVNNKIIEQEFSINKYFENIYSSIVEILSPDIKILPYMLYELIKNSELISLSEDLANKNKQENFNYCIFYASKYLPNIPININSKLDSLYRKLTIMESSYKSGDLKRTLEEANKNFLFTEKQMENNVIEVYEDGLRRINEDFAKYILIWLRAYRITMAIRECRKQEDIIAYSHQYKGWSLPDYQLVENLKLNFKTNFGYGNSSYFYLLLEYKGVQIFPFMDWCSYEHTQASELIKYSKLIHGKKTIIKNREIVINSSSWYEAIDYALKAGNILIENENNFINIYIVEPIENLIINLEEILNIPDEELNEKYKNFDYGFDIREIDEDLVERVKKIKLMDVKGARISGALTFITQFAKLANTIKNTENYIKKIEELNLKIKPILLTSISEANELISRMTKEVDSVQSKLILFHQGSDTNIGLSIIEKDKKILDLDEFNIKYSNYDEIKKHYDSLIDSKRKFQENLNNSQKLINNINRYIKDIEKYFNSVN